MRSDSAKFWPIYARIIETAMGIIRQFVSDERGQDLVEYTLLIAFVTIMSAVLLTVNQEAIANIWSKTEDRLLEAQTKSL
jgi:Flp pilus assembly pilin Flp